MNDLKIVYFDMDDVMADFTGASVAALRAEPGIQWPQSQYGFFENLEPIPGSIECFKKIDSIEGVKALILSRPSVLNPLCYTEKMLWVKKHLGQEYVDRLILSCHKQLSIGDYLIDDQAPSWEGFQGELIHFKSESFPNHEAVLEYLLPKLAK